MNKRTKKISLIILVLLTLIVVTVGFIFISNALSKKVYASTYNQSLSVEEKNDVTSEVKSRSTTAVTAVAEEDSDVLVAFSFAGGVGGTKRTFATYGEEMPSGLIAPTKENYTFLGYYDDDTNKQYYDANMNSTSICDVEDMLILTAHWKGKEVIITLDHSGGVSNTDIIIISYGDFFKKVEVPEREGYEFLGYYIDENTLVFKNDGFPDSKTEKCEYIDDITLTAKWELKIYNIDFQLTNEKINGKLPLDFYMPKTYTIKDVEKKDIVFDKICKGDYRINFAPSKIEKGSAQDICIYGTWVEKYTIISYSLDGGKNNVNNIKDYIGEDDRPVSGKRILKLNETLDLADPTKIGYKFDGWYFGGKKITSVSCCDEESIILRAKWINRIKGYNYNMSMDTSYISTGEHGAMTIKLPIFNLSRTCTISVSQYTKQVHIFAEEFKVYSLNIIILSRDTDFDLYLENCGIHSAMLGSTSPNTISMSTTNKSVLNLYAYGQVFIKGNSPSQNPYGNGLNGSHAIKCSSLYIKHAEKLGIYGGDAGKGASGYSNGSPAVAVYIDEKLYRPESNDIVTIAGGYHVGRPSQASGFSGGVIVFLDEDGNIIEF